MQARIEVTRLIPGIVAPVLNQSVAGTFGADGDEADIDMTVWRQSGFRRYGFEGSAILLFGDLYREEERCEFRGAVSGTTVFNPWHSFNGRVLIFNDDQDEGFPTVAMTQAMQGELNHEGYNRSTVVRPPNVVQPNDHQLETLEDLSARANAIIIMAARVAIWQQTIP